VPQPDRMDSLNTTLTLKISSFFTWIGYQLKKRRWVIMLLFGASVIVIEGREHIGLGDSLISQHFAIEIIVYGILIPFLGVILLSVVDKAEIRRNELAIEIEQKKQLISQLNSALNWDDLIDLIIRLPSKILPVISSALLIKSPDGSGFRIATSKVYDSTKDLDPDLDANLCQSCIVSSLPSSTINSCSSQSDGQSGVKSKRYCLPLLCGDYMTGILSFVIPKNHVITSNQSSMLVDLSTDLALALENARLQNLIRNQTAVSEAERKRIARHLHDTLGQNISYLRLKLDQISGQTSLIGIAEIRDDLARMRDIADEAYIQIRGTLAELQPSAQIDLERSLRAHTAKVSARANFPISIVTQGNPLPLPPHVKREILYICREALNNIEKHASAQSVSIELLWTQADLMITIADDGIGFNPQSMYDEDHLGLTIMAERAGDINACLLTDSQPEQGTRISLKIPLITLQANP
jgi:signal transduction histidine kinase